MLFKRLFDQDHYLHHKIDNLLLNQVSLPFLVAFKYHHVYLEISTCCSVTKPIDYEYIPYQPKQSSTTNDYVSFSFFLLLNSFEFDILG